MNDLQQKAIDAALKCDWERALDYNLAIIQENPTNLQALNRLAKAYMEIGDKSEAKMVYKQVLKLDKYNSVATKNLRLLPQKNSSTQMVAQEDFIEEPGCTKTVHLIKICGKDILAALYAKQPLSLKTFGRLVGLITANNQRIGTLPDDLSFKLKTLLRRSYHYAACIKSVEDNKITIFLRETKRPKRYLEISSFSSQLSYQSLKK